MTGTRRLYTGEFKREANRLYETSGKSVRQIEMDLDITPGLLNKWCAGQRIQGQQAFVGSGHQTELEAELRRLNRENEILRQERDIKKSHSVVGQGRTLSYDFIQQQQNQFEVKIMCRILEVSVSG